MISTTCLVTLALCLSPFSSGGSKKVLPMRSLGSNVGIGLDPDGFSSSLDLMKTVGAFCSSEEPYGDPSGDPEEILSSEGSEDACRILGLTAFNSLLQYVNWLVWEVCSVN